MTQSDENYLLVVFDTIDDPEPIRDLLCRAAGLHPTDAMQWIACMPGIVKRPLDKSTIERVLDELYELQIAAEARRVGSIPNLAPARNARDVACHDDGFRVKGMLGEPTHWVPWTKIELVHAAWVEQQDETRAVGAPTWVTAVRNAINTIAGRPRLLIGRRERTLRVPRDPVREIVVVRSDPLLALRMNENSLNYAYLGQRLRPTSSENFPLLLDDICRRADPLSLTASSRALWKDGSAASEAASCADSHQLLEQSVLWLLWRWYKRDREQDMRGRKGGA